MSKHFSDEYSPHEEDPRDEKIFQLQEQIAYLRNQVTYLQEELAGAEDIVEELKAKIKEYES